MAHKFYVDLAQSITWARLSWGPARCDLKLQDGCCWAEPALQGSCLTVSCFVGNKIVGGLLLIHSDLGIESLRVSESFIKV
jgi:hypothetical protein